MSEIFGPGYAAPYDALYNEKDYRQESSLIDRLFQSHGNGAVRRVLDLGCGTGSHVFPLAERGYEVVGVDRSAGMLDAARKRAAARQVDGKASFYQDDIRSFHAEQSFDAALMMFAVLGYQLENRDVLAALRTARKHPAGRAFHIRCLVRSGGAQPGPERAR